MDESAIVDRQNHRKRSNSENNAFAKFVPLAVGDDGASEEPNPEGQANGRKRLRLNSDASLSDSAYNFSSPFPSQSMTSNTPQFSTPSTSRKHSADTRPSPSSINSKSHIEYEELGVKWGQSPSSVNYNWKEDRIELESACSMASEQLSKRPKIGGIYEAIAVHRESTVKRLKDLCNEDPKTDVGIEMADAAFLLKLMNSSTPETEHAAQKAQRGAMLLLQAEILRKNGLRLLSESQDLLRDTL